MQAYFKRKGPRSCISDLTQLLGGKICMTFTAYSYSDINEWLVSLCIFLPDPALEAFGKVWVFHLKATPKCVFYLEKPCFFP